MSDATVSFDLADVLGESFDPSRTILWVQFNTPNNRVTDADGKIRVGQGRTKPNADGTGTITGIPIPSGATNPTNFQVRIHYDAPPRLKGNNAPRQVGDFGWMTITGDADLNDLEAEQYAPPEYQGAFVSELTGLRNDAAAERAGAEAAAAAAVDISNIEVDDDIVEALVKNTGGAGPKTSAALTATVGRAQFAVSDSGLFVADDGNNANDGLSPGLAKATIAAAHAALPSGKGRINVGGGVHTVTGLELTSGLTIDGFGAQTGVTILNSPGDVFVVPEGELVQDVVMRNLSITTEGSAFAIDGMLAMSTFEDLYLAQIGGGHPLIDAAGLIDTKWRFVIESVSGDTTPLVRLLASEADVDAIACNSFTGRSTHKTGYAFHIEDATGVSYAENNKIFDFNFEQADKGAAKILSGTGNILDNALALDFTTAVTVPLVYIGKSASSAKVSIGNRINWHRHGGNLSNGAAFDVKLEGSARAPQTTLLDCWGDAGGFKADLGGNQVAVLNTELLAVTDAALAQGPAFFGMKFIHENPDNLISAANAGAGLAMVKPSSHKLLISDGTNWRDAMGNIV